LTPDRLWKTFSKHGRLLDLGFDCLASAEKEQPAGKVRGEGNKEAIQKGEIRVHRVPETHLSSDRTPALLLEVLKLVREHELHDGVHRSRLPNHLVAEQWNPDARASHETLHERRAPPREL